MDSPPVADAILAAKAVAIRFRLDGYRGLIVLAPGYPKWRRVVCETGRSPDPIENYEPIEALGGLSYKELTDMYSLPWKSSVAWKGTCRESVLKLADGEDHAALCGFD